jgi:hypothetical protein
VRSSIVSVFRKVLALALILVIGITSFATPASAYDGSYEKEPFVIELGKEAVKTATNSTVAFLAPPTICFAADAVATAFFPPAAMLAPYCASMGVTASVAAATAAAGIGSVKIAQKAMAY